MYIHAGSISAFKSQHRNLNSPVKDMPKNGFELMDRWDAERQAAEKDIGSKQPLAHRIMAAFCCGGKAANNP